MCLTTCVPCPFPLPSREPCRFHSVTLFAPLDSAFARLPAGFRDVLFDPSNVELARYILLVRGVHAE